MLQLFRLHRISCVAVMMASLRQAWRCGASGPMCLACFVASRHHYVDQISSSFVSHPGHKPHWKKLVKGDFKVERSFKTKQLMKQRPRKLMEVSQLDQKLLWAELDEEQSGAVTWLKEALKHQNWKWRKEKFDEHLRVFVGCKPMRSLSIALSWLLLDWIKLLWNPFRKTTWPTGWQTAKQGSGYSSSGWFPFSICSDCFRLKPHVLTFHVCPDWEKVSLKRSHLTSILIFNICLGFVSMEHTNISLKRMVRMEQSHAKNSRWTSSVGKRFFVVIFCVFA